MKRVLYLIPIVLFFACTNTQKESKETVNEKQEPATGQSLVDSVPDVDEGVRVLHPSGNELELDEKEGGGHMDQEAARLFRQATASYDNNDFESGIRLFKQFLEKEPEDERAYYNLGVGYFKLDKFAEAIKAFTEAIKLDPENSLAFQYRGKVYYVLENYKSSLADYNRVVELKPNDPLSYYNRGTTRGKVNDYTNAIDDFNKAIELDPEYAKAYFHRGLANFFLGRVHDACYDWNKAHTLGHYAAEKAIRDYCEGKKE